MISLLCVRLEAHRLEEVAADVAIDHDPAFYKVTSYKLQVQK